jgi:hypothetical protein
LPPRRSAAVAAKKAHYCAGSAEFWMGITNSAQFKQHNAISTGIFRQKWLERLMDIA